MPRFAESHLGGCCYRAHRQQATTACDEVMRQAIRAGAPRSLWHLQTSMGDQVADYQRRKGLRVAEIERWLAPNLNDDPDAS